ncbi:hypothetical protein FRX31_028355 [Thalictrum thalictroides]|uniref:Uncharacterized protein n=1 Tax=Thalictrum thalictroides TaxID=46969 RepID=A0A7J6VBH9_THATH|nr:hypothetical protein FRX31_028355 [Thalictrum thalictroides]
MEGMADEFEKLAENASVELGVLKRAVNNTNQLDVLRGKVPEPKAFADFKAHTSSSAEDGEKKDMGKTRSKGCFICDGPHRDKACPKREELDDLETEGKSDEESDEVSEENSDEEESEDNSDDEESEGDSDEESKEESEGEEVVAGVPE